MLRKSDNLEIKKNKNVTTDRTGPKMSGLSRRNFLAAGGTALGATFSPPSVFAQSRARVVVIGGGFGGATFARFLRKADPTINVTLIEPNSEYTACPFSNLVLGGERNLSQQRFNYKGLENAGITVVPDSVIHVDAEGKTVRTANGIQLEYDRLLMAPGIDFIWNRIEGYDEDATKVMPHAWKAGSQTKQIISQLTDMDDGGLVVISAPANPFRCPPGPYERASLIAHYLKSNKPKSKIIILDAKDSFSKQPLFQQAWKSIYGDMIEWVGFSDGGAVVSVNAKEKSLSTDFDQFSASVANIIPPQKAGEIAHQAGVTDASGWCPIDPVSFESLIHPNIHIIGDASIANAMPKSAFSANAQAKVCAIQVARMLRGEDPLPTTLVNTCFSLIAPDYAISVAGVYQPKDKHLAEVEGAGGVSPKDATTEVRNLEARYANDWFKAITSEVYG